MKFIMLIHLLSSSYVCLIDSFILSLVILKSKAMIKLPIIYMLN